MLSFTTGIVHSLYFYALGVSERMVMVEGMILNQDWQASDDLVISQSV